MTRRTQIFVLVLLAVVIPNPAEGHIMMRQPVGGESFAPGSTVSIAWDVIEHGEAQYFVYYSADGGITWETIGSHLIQSTLTFDWVVPADETTHGRIRVFQDNLAGTDYAGSSGDFSIEAVATGVDKSNLRRETPGSVSVYPNPFSVSTTLEFTLAQAQHVTLEVFDIRGAVVDVLVDETLPAGKHLAYWRVAAIPNGVYLIRINADGHTGIRTAVLLR